MIDIRSKIVETLSEILPTYYELYLQSEVELPCVTYTELSDVAREEGDTLRYSDHLIQVKLNAKDLTDIVTYTPLIDAALWELGGKRSSSQEFTLNANIVKVITYEFRTLEEETT